MKPTQIECSKGSFNQIPAETTMHGDIRQDLRVYSYVYVIMILDVTLLLHIHIYIC